MNAISTRSLQYYVVARRWSSDLEFFRLETAFLHKLMDSYQPRLSDDEHIRRLIAAGKGLFNLEKEELVTDKILTTQIKQLGLMADDIIPEDAESLAETQTKLEYYMVHLTKEYPTIKSEVFQLIASVIREDELLHQ